MKFKMFHTPKPRKFGYTPIYYNPDEEETVTTRKKKSADSANDPDGQNKYWDHNKERITRKKSMNMTWYIIIAVLLLYMIFFT